MNMPAIGDHVYIDEGDSVGDQEYAGVVMNVIGTNVELSLDEDGARKMVNLELVADWQVDN